MNEQIVAEEPEIDLLDFLFRMLEQWRGWLILGLIMALLVPSVKYVRDASLATANGNVTETGNTTADESDGTLETTLSDYNAWQAKKTYYEKSVRMHIDPEEARTLTLLYYITAEDTSAVDVTALGQAYAMQGGEDAFLTALGDGLGLDTATGYVHELCTVEAAGGGTANDRQLGTTLTVTILLPDTADENDAEAAVTTYFETLSERLNDSFGAHTITFRSSAVARGLDMTLSETQMTTFAGVLSAKKTYQTDFAALDEEAQAEVLSLIAAGKTDGYEEDEDVSDIGGDMATNLAATEAAEPVFSVKYALLGFLLGAVLYAGIAFIYMLLARRIRTEDELVEMSGLRSMGAIYEYPYTSALTRFLHDKNVYAWRHRHALSADDGKNAVAVSLLAKAKHIDAGDITVLTLGAVSEWVRGILQAQTDALSSEGIGVKRLDAENGVSSVDEAEFDGMKPVFLVVLSDKTKPRMVAEMLLRLREYAVPVIGTEILEGP